MKEVIFIHIPKNGGMTIRHKESPILKRIIVAERKNHKSKEYSDAVLKTMNKYKQHHGYEHARWRDLNPSLTSKYPAFAIVRNPWSKVISRYTFAMIQNLRPNNYSLEQFLEERHKWGGIPYFWHRAVYGWYPQTDYVTDKEANLKCDILRFEHFDEDVMTYFNLKKPLHVRNVSNGKKSQDKTKIEGKKDYKEFYTEETREIVAYWYQQDIEFFGFTFEGSATKNIWNTQ